MPKGNEDREIPCHPRCMTGKKGGRGGQELVAACTPHMHACNTALIGRGKAEAQPHHKHTPSRARLTRPATFLTPAVCAQRPPLIPSANTPRACTPRAASARTFSVRLAGAPARFRFAPRDWFSRFVRYSSVMSPAAWCVVVGALLCLAGATAPGLCECAGAGGCHYRAACSEPVLYAWLGC